MILTKGSTKAFFHKAADRIRLMSRHIRELKMHPLQRAARNKIIAKLIDLVKIGEPTKLDVEQKSHVVGVPAAKIPSPAEDPEDKHWYAFGSSSPEVPEAKPCEWPEFSSQGSSPPSKRRKAPSPKIPATPDLVEVSSSADAEDSDDGLQEPPHASDPANDSDASAETLAPLPAGKGAQKAKALLNKTLKSNIKKRPAAKVSEEQVQAQSSTSSQPKPELAPPSDVPFITKVRCVGRRSPPEQIHHGSPSRC